MNKEYWIVVVDFGGECCMSFVRFSYVSALEMQEDLEVTHRLAIPRPKVFVASLGFTGSEVGKEVR